MKASTIKVLTVVITIVMFVSSSCNEDEVIPKRSDQELFEMTMEKIAANEGILEDVFAETATVVTRTAIQNALKTSSTKAAFISNMNALVDEIFENEVKSNSGQLASDVFLKIDGAKGESVAQTVSEFILDPNFEDPLVSYSNKVKSLVETGSASGRGLLVLIQKVVDDETSESAPAEQVSLNYDKIKVMYELLHNVIMAGKEGMSAETDEQIDNILLQKGVPPVAIGLLLPAVQKIRECCPPETSSMPYWEWEKICVNPEINGGLNRDIIRRYNVAGFMGALQLLLSNEYKNDNQDLASMLLLRARYQASLMFIWNDIWEKSKLAVTMNARVKSNEAILEAAFVETAKVVTRNAIIDARTASVDKAAFVSKMNALVEGIFDREVQKKSETFGGGVVIATGGLDGDGTTSQLADLIIKNDPDPLTTYSDKIQALIDSRSKSQENSPGGLTPGFTIVNRVLESGVEKESFMSVTTGSMSSAKKLKEAVLYGRKSGADPDKAIADLAVANNIPAPLMGMLVPAVQKVRLYNATAETADTPYLQWLDSLDPLMPAGVTHDVVTKYDAAGFLGAVNLFVSNQYRADNQDYASLLLLKARYQASLAMIFGDLWDK